MKRSVIALVCVAVSGSLACGSSLMSGADSGPDAAADGTKVVEASEPDGGKDARPPPDDAGSDAGHDATMGADGPSEGGTADRRAPHDGHAQEDAGDDDAPDGEAEDASDSGGEVDSGGCLAQAPDSATGLFVVVGGSTSTTCGTLSKPCASIDLALTVAAGSPAITTIYVGPGKFTETATVPLSNGIAIVGGWDVVGKTWTHSCVAPEIRGPSPVFSATSLSSVTTLDTLDIAETDVASTGGSLYGITSYDSALSLRDVSVDVQAGGAGTNAKAPGGPGAAGSSGGCNTPASGDAGASGEAGAPSDPGSFYAPPMCFQPASDAKHGATGDRGGVGTPGGPGATGEGVVGCSYEGSSCVFSGKTFQGDPGKPGCPGSGGQGGEPGTSGGCSIAVYAWGGSVTIAGGSLTTSHGGRGGDGTAGGDGGAGAKGVRGAGVSYMAGCIRAKPGECKEDEAYADGGVAGGPGGPGGAGGPGGGGAGGCSYAYFIGADASVAASDASINLGPGGPGGDPNGPTGPSSEHN